MREGVPGSVRLSPIMGSELMSALLFPDIATDGSSHDVIFNMEYPTTFWSECFRTILTEQDAISLKEVIEGRQRIMFLEGYSEQDRGPIKAEMDSGHLVLQFVRKKYLMRFSREMTIIIQQALNQNVTDTYGFKEPEPEIWK